MLHSPRPQISHSLAAGFGARQRAALVSGLLAALLLPGSETWGAPWAEVRDAGSIDAQTPAFDPEDTFIEFLTGCLTYRLRGDEDIDLFRVRIDNFEQFSFAVDAGAANLDPKIYLFNVDGTGIATRDDGRPGISISPQPELPVDCEIPEGSEEQECGKYGYGDLPGGEYLLGITRHDIVPYAPNPSTEDGAKCPGEPMLDDEFEYDPCPIFPSTSLPPIPNDPTDPDDVPRDEWDFSTIQNPYPTKYDADGVVTELGMDNESVTEWRVVPPPVDDGGLILTGEYTATLRGVLFASGDDTGLIGRTTCALPEPSSSAAVGCAVVLLMRGMRGTRKRKPQG